MLMMIWILGLIYGVDGGGEYLRVISEERDIARWIEGRKGRIGGQAFF